MRRLGAILRTEHPQLLAHLQALRSPASFRASFLLPSPPPGNPLRATRMAPRLWSQLVASGATVPVPKPRRRPFSCALRLVADRKAEGTARVIFPVVALNSACRPPPPTPTPRLHHLLEGVLRHRLVVTADAKGWFFALRVPAAVAAVFFALYREGKWYGAARGLLGWRWMPYLMASVALVLLTVAVRRAMVAATPFVWIDNFVVGVDSPAAGRAVLDNLHRLAEHVGATLHEVTPPATKARVVGTEVDLSAGTWRLSSAWAEGFIAYAALRDTARRLPLRELWRLMGATSWATYAAQLPQVWQAPLLDHAAAVAKDFQAGRVGLDAVVPYPRVVRDCVRAAATYAGVNPWRRFGGSFGRPVFTDAAGDGGVGILVPSSRGRYREVAERVHDPPHINSLELLAAARGLSLSSPRPGSTTQIIVDNAAAAYQLASWSARAALSRTTLRGVAEWAARRGVAVDPLLIPTAHQPADGPSRALRAGSRTFAFEPRDSAAHAYRTRRDRAAIVILPPGWHRPVPRSMFRRVLERSLGGLRVPA